MNLSEVHNIAQSVVSSALQRVGNPTGVTTTDATSTPAVTVETEEGTVGHIKAFVVAADADLNTLVSVRQVGWKNSGGVASLIGAVSTQYSAGTLAGTVDILADGSSIKVQVTGIAATEINWTISYDLKTVVAPQATVIEM